MRCSSSTTTRRRRRWSGCGPTSGSRAATTAAPTCPRPRSSSAGAAASCCCPTSTATPRPISSRRRRSVPSPETAELEHTADPTALGTVLVTGGASGLGAAVADAVAAHGGTPVVLDLAEAADGVDAERVDLADTRAAEAAVRAAAERHGGFDAVVTAAGIDACGRLEDVDPEQWERVVTVNLLGTAAVARA